MWPPIVAQINRIADPADPFKAKRIGVIFTNITVCGTLVVASDAIIFCRLYCETFGLITTDEKGPERPLW